MAGFEWNVSPGGQAACGRARAQGAATALEGGSSQWLVSAQVQVGSVQCPEPTWAKSCLQNTKVLDGMTGRELWAFPQTQRGEGATQDLMASQEGRGEARPPDGSVCCVSGAELWELHL